MYIGVFLYICLGKSVRSPRTRLTDSCKLLYGCWELNHSPLQVQPVLLTTESLHSQPCPFDKALECVSKAMPWLMTRMA